MATNLVILAPPVNPPAPPAPRLPSLFDLESNLAAFVDSVETVEPGQEEQFLADFTSALTEAKEKRDRVGGFMAFVESQALLAKTEIERLKARKARYERTLERMEHYVTAVIKNLDLDAKGKWQTLEGNTTTFRLRNNPPTVSLTDEAAVPARYKTVTVTMPAEDWESLMDSVPLEVRERVLGTLRHPDAAVLKTPIAQAIKEQVPDWKDLLKTSSAVHLSAIPGAALIPGGTSLVRE